MSIDIEKIPEETNEILAESEPREALPRVGKPMAIKETKKPEHQNIPGVDEIDREQEISWDNLVFVRTTDVAPKNKNGRLVIETPYSGTKNRPLSEVDQRTTTHWAINHHVRATAGGWRREGSEELPYIIIAPAKGMIELNAKPRNFADVDTFWDKDLVLPEGTVIVRRPGTEFKIPSSFKNKTHVIDRDPSRPAAADIADVLEHLGFTPIKGGQKYSRTKGVDKVFDNFAKWEKLESGVHQFDETNRFEAKYSQMDNPKYLLHVLHFFLNPGRKPVNEQAEELIRRKLRSVAETDGETMKKIAERYEMSIEEIEDIFEQAKDLLQGRI
jgi:hypothetical protein